MAFSDGTATGREALLVSVQAMAWVFDHAVTESTGDRLVLLSLANHADRQGRAAFPRVANIAQEAALSERQVTRALSRLETAGLIERDSWPDDRPEPPTNRRPKCWRLAMARGDNMSPQDSGSGVTYPTVRGDISDTSGVTNRAPYKEEPSLEPSITVPNTLAAEPPTEAHPVEVVEASTRRQDVLFETLCDVCGIIPADLTPTARGPLNRALKELRDLGATPGDVIERAKVYLVTYNTTLSPMALAKHWPTLGGNGPMVGVGERGREEFERQRHLAEIDARRNGRELPE